MLIIERFSSHRGVVFETLGDYVERWKDGNALDRWASENPLYAGRGPHMKHTGKRGEET